MHQETLQSCSRRIDNATTVSLVDDLHNIIEYITMGVVSISFHTFNKHERNVWSIQGPNEDLTVMLCYKCGEESVLSDEWDIKPPIKPELIEEYISDEQTKGAANIGNSASVSASEATQFEPLVPMSLPGSTLLPIICQPTQYDEKLVPPTESDIYDSITRNHFQDLQHFQHLETTRHDEETSLPVLESNRACDICDFDSDYEIDHGMYHNTMQQDDEISVMQFEKSPRTFSLDDSETYVYLRDEVPIISEDEVASLGLEAREKPSVPAYSESPSSEHATNPVFSTNQHQYDESQELLPWTLCNKQIEIKECSVKLETLEVPTIDSSHSPATQCNEPCDNSIEMQHNNRNENAKNSYECSQCAIEFDCFQTYKQHRCRHVKKKNYQCFQCNQNFSSPHRLEMHSQVHVADKRYRCSQCGKKFSHFCYLKMHRAVHLKQCFECSQCKKLFPSKKRLNSHNRSHTREAPFDCSFCGIKIRYRRNVKRHQKLYCRMKMSPRETK